MNFATRELNVIGHCPSSTRTNEWYGRSACAHELPLRGAVIQKMVTGWNMVGSLCIPESVGKVERIGREPAALTGTVCEPDSPPATQLVETTAQGSAATHSIEPDGTPAELGDELGHVGKPDLQLELCP